MDAPNTIHALRIVYEQIQRSLKVIAVIQFIQAALLLAVTWKVFWG